MPEKAGWRVRKAVLSDLDRLVEIEGLSDPPPWSAEAYQDYLEGKPDKLALVVCRQGEGLAVGFVLARLLGRELEILKIAVGPGERRQGLASLLLGQLVKEAEETGAGRIMLEVREENKAARQLYQKLGFEGVGRREAYYPDSREAAILMDATLASLGIVDNKQARGAD